MKALLLIIAIANGTPSTVELDSMEACKKLQVSIQAELKKDFGDLAEAAFKIYCLEQ